MPYVNLFNVNALTERRAAVGASVQPAPRWGIPENMPPPQTPDYSRPGIYPPPQTPDYSRPGIYPPPTTQPIQDPERGDGPPPGTYWNERTGEWTPIQPGGDTPGAMPSTDNRRKETAPIDYSTIPAPSFNTQTGFRPLGTYLNTLTGQYEPVRASRQGTAGGFLGTDFLKLVYPTQSQSQTTGKPPETYWNENTGQRTPIQLDGNTPVRMPRAYDYTARTARFESLSRAARLQ